MNVLNMLDPSGWRVDRTPPEALPWGWTAVDLWTAPVVTGLWASLTHWRVSRLFISCIISDVFPGSVILGRHALELFKCRTLWEIRRETRCPRGVGPFRRSFPLYSHLGDSIHMPNLVEHGSAPEPQDETAIDSNAVRETLELDHVHRAVRITQHSN